MYCTRVYKHLIHYNEYYLLVILHFIFKKKFFAHHLVLQLLEYSIELKMYWYITIKELKLIFFRSLNDNTYEIM